MNMEMNSGCVHEFSEVGRGVGEVLVVCCGCGEIEGHDEVEEGRLLDRLEREEAVFEEYGWGERMLDRVARWWFGKSY